MAFVCVRSVHCCRHCSELLCRMPPDFGVLQYCTLSCTLRAFPETVVVGQAVAFGHDVNVTCKKLIEITRLT